LFHIVNFFIQYTPVEGVFVLIASLKPPWPVNPRDLKIFRFRIAEKKKIRELANMYDISMKRVWGICTRIRKCGINESGEEVEAFSECLSLAETT